MKRTQLQKKVEEFVSSRNKDFRFEDIAGDPRVAETRGFSEKALLDILETGGLVFSRDFNLFKPRHLFFRGARFIVSPTEEETLKRILIPGHRFEPFCCSRIFPWDRVLLPKDGKKESPVPKKIVKRTANSLLVYYTLLGQENFPGLLNDDQAENEAIMAGEIADGPGGKDEGGGVIPFPQDDFGGIFETAEFSITVFDFSALFKEWGFQFGDGILCEVTDWASGVFTVEYLPKKRRNELMENSSAWIGKLEKGFLKTFDDLGLAFPIQEQIAYAYYFAGAQVLKDPPLHLGGFIDSSPRVNIVSVGIETRLWRENRIDGAALGIDDLEPAPTGATGSLDAIFKDLNFAVTETEVEAYMRDELFRRKDDLDAVFNRVFHGRPPEFFSDGQMNDFMRYFRKLWNHVKKNYNYFADQLSGKARGRILDIFDRHYAWMRGFDSLDIEEEDIPMQEMAGLSQAMEFLTETLRVLNRKPSIRGEDGIKESLEFLPRLEELIEEMQAAINDKLEARPEKPEKREGLRLVKNGNDAPKKSSSAGNVYVFRISLLYITPQIWRTFQVPGSYTLEEFHRVIQNVMGWGNYHLHSFEIAGRLYGPRLEDDMDFGPEQFDEDDFTLDSLKLREKQKIQYTYDFGDSWEHQITLTKAVPAAECPPEDLEAPRCLGGKRACPLEDCGGPGGYDDIVEALKQPGKRKNRDLLDWAGDYNPEDFDADAVNDTLRGK